MVINIILVVVIVVCSLDRISEVIGLVVVGSRVLVLVISNILFLW